MEVKGVMSPEVTGCWGWGWGGAVKHTNTFFFCFLVHKRQRCTHPSDRLSSDTPSILFSHNKNSRLIHSLPCSGFSSISRLLLGDWQWTGHLTLKQICGCLETKWEINRDQRRKDAPARFGVAPRRAHSRAQDAFCLSSEWKWLGHTGSNTFFFLSPSGDRVCDTNTW